MKKTELRQKLAKDKDLEVWIRTLLTVYPTIPNIERVINRIIESRACNLSSSYAYNGQIKHTSYAEVNKILAIIERKDKLIEVYQLIRDLINRIDKEDLKFVEMRFFHRIKPEKIATRKDVCLRTVYRLTARIIEKLALSCMESGISSLYLSERTREEPWIHAQFEKIKAEKETNYKRGRNEVYKIEGDSESDCLAL